MSTTVADIFRMHFNDFLAQHPRLPRHFFKAVNALVNCRTEHMGGRLYQCREQDCGYRVILYNSCRNRHCPQCQSKTSIEWTRKRMQELLPVPYFHVVFTMPSELRSLARANNALVYRTMFDAAAQTMMRLGQDPKHLGGKLGMVSILHTWKQNLDYHPHLHCLIPGGVLTDDRSEWIEAKSDFLFPVAVMQKLFRARFLVLLKKKIRTHELYLGQDTGVKRKLLKRLIKQLYKRKWHVYVKPGFASAEHLVTYLSRYTHRVAISNRRLLSLQNGIVRFTYIDRKDGDTQKVMSIEAVEFIRRFLLHILPTGFMKMRYYGLLSNRTRQAMVQQCLELLSENRPTEMLQCRTAALEQVIEELCAMDTVLCSQCGAPMVQTYVVFPKRREVTGRGVD